jgi:hypothetical protein
VPFRVTTREGPADGTELCCPGLSLSSLMGMHRVGGPGSPPRIDCYDEQRSWRRVLYISGTEFAKMELSAILCMHLSAYIYVSVDVGTKGPTVCTIYVNWLQLTGLAASWGHILSTQL